MNNAQNGSTKLKVKKKKAFGGYAKLEGPKWDLNKIAADIKEIDAE